MPHCPSRARFELMGLLLSAYVWLFKPDWPFRDWCHIHFNTKGALLGTNGPSLALSRSLNVNFKTNWALLGTYETFIYVFLGQFETK